jgi:hypothetical protein
MEMTDSNDCKDVDKGIDNRGHTEGLKELLSCITLEAEALQLVLDSLVQHASVISDVLVSMTKDNTPADEEWKALKENEQLQCEVELDLLTLAETKENAIANVPIHWYRRLWSRDSVQMGHERMETRHKQIMMDVT